MLRHRFRRPKESPEQYKFLRSLRRGTFKGLFENLIERTMCLLRIHVSELRVDENGFYQICDRCRYYEPVSVWESQRRSRDHRRFK